MVRAFFVIILLRLPILSIHPFLFSLRVLAYLLSIILAVCLCVSTACKAGLRATYVIIADLWSDCMFSGTEGI